MITAHSSPKRIARTYKTNLQDTPTNISPVFFLQSLTKMSSNSLVVILTSLCVGALAAIGPVADLPIVNKVIAPDGFSRSAVLAGGTFPGPVITARKGDRLKINVKDELSDSSMDLPTSIHWHGLFQKTTNYADGAAFVNQCPIIPKHSFLYDFDTRNQAGTFWYHSHFATQYCDGLRGAIVIYDDKDPQKYLYDVDDESTVITLADWYHYNSHDPEAQGNPTWASGLINGKGRFPGGPKNVSLSVVNVAHGKRYRFRLVQISCDPSFIFSIQQHLLTIIEVDGNNVHPLVVDNLQIFPGQRYSVVLHANQPVANYWIHSQPIDPYNITSVVSSLSGGQNSAILRYAGAPPREPKTTSSTLRLPLVETNLHPLNNARAPGKPVPGGADINILLNITIDPTVTHFVINNATYAPPSVPALLQILSGASAAQDLLPKGSYFGLAPNKVVELSIPGGAFGGPHPVHLHGHAFSVVRSAGNATYNFDNPVVRDVVNLGETTDDVTIRFVTDNPGPWFFHCHIDWHLSVGFAAVFVEDAPDIPSRDPIPKAWQDLCPLYNKFLNSTS
ncbi:multicopper oxidase [Auriscalpium vulgare]|uniref:Multicopper oxidase n=1 Tax=Auriscalpium vulgare TaxID=40419 RepID=A0ACB8RI60_9AGAM|nr:multicopper oxidase [Auriscalpium vulgare]